MNAYFVTCVDYKRMHWAILQKFIAHMTLRQKGGNFAGRKVKRNDSLGFCQ